MTVVAETGLKVRRTPLVNGAVKRRAGNPAWVKGMKCPHIRQKGDKLLYPRRKAVTNRLITDICRSYQDRGGVCYLSSLSDALFVRLLERTIPVHAELSGEVSTAVPLRIELASNGGNSAGNYESLGRNNAARQALPSP